MEITRENFVESLPAIKESLCNADFIAIDAEFSGLQTKDALDNYQDTIDARYQKMRKNVQDFTILQYGICAFSRKQSGAFEAKPYNFYIWGSGETKRNFLASEASIKFLRRNKFDFNKLIDDGIPFFNQSECQAAYSSNSRASNGQLAAANSVFSALVTDNNPFFKKAKANIERWLDRSQKNGLTLQINSNVQRQIVNMIISDKRKDGVFLKVEQRDTKHLVVNRMSEEERRVENRKIKTPYSSQNFRTIIEYISDSKKPVVVHNGIFDICHTFDQFWDYLPNDVLEFKKRVTEMWPLIVDTKYLVATLQSHLKVNLGFSSLQNVFNFARSKLQERNINIDMADGFTRYMTEEYNHEAGYDAYMTGCCYAGLMKLIADEESLPWDRSTFTDSKISRRYNKIFLMNSYYQLIDLKSDVDIDPRVQGPNIFYLDSIPEGTKAETITAIFPEIGPLTVRWVNVSAAWLQSMQPHAVKTQTGVIGKDRIMEYLPGGRKEGEGNRLDIKPDHMAMRLFSYEEWRNHPEFNAGPETPKGSPKGSNPESPAAAADETEQRPVDTSSKAGKRKRDTRDDDESQRSPKRR